MTLKFDVHNHTKYSPDSNIEPRDIVKYATKNHLDFIAVTDHNNIKGALAAKKYETDTLKIIIGEEVTTSGGGKHNEGGGEVIGLFLTEQIDKHQSLEATIDEIRAQNGVVLMPHPFDFARGSAYHPSEEQAKLFDCVEGFNARCYSQKYNIDAVKYANRHKLTSVAGSDAHVKREIGNAWNITECDNVREALLSNKVQFDGEKTFLANHIFSKGIKKWREVKSGSLSFLQ
jgi:predicted metal-dependent phosphoesterase TrpH